VFISYRRQETAWPARQLYELLSERFGADQVFKDIDTIEPGDDFVEKLTEAVGSCDVLLALIGETWLMITGEDGRPRLSNPDDYVRLEIETALGRSDVRVIPILVDSARMPKADELPPKLRPLTRRQSVHLSAINFDASRLMRAVQDTLADINHDPTTPADRPAEVPPSQPPPVDDPADRRESLPASDDGEPRRTRAGRRVIVALVAALILLVGGLVLWNGQRQGHPSPSSGGQTVASSSASASSSGTASAAGTDGSAILAHRGGFETYPLESLPALRSAAMRGFAVETDVRWTSDDVPVIVHDEAATEGLECTRPVLVSHTTFKTLTDTCRSTQSRQDGKRYPIATYPQAMEAIAAANPAAWAYVEIKVDRSPAQLRQFVAVIRRQGVSKRTVVTSFDAARLKAVHAVAPDLRLMLFLGTRKAAPRDVAFDGLWGVAIDSTIATKTYVRALHDAGLTVIDFLLNEERDWAKAEAVGADKVLTDNPMAYEAWLAKH
jgi:glycerophosphoryl diester phosphodiesterase